MMFLIIQELKTLPSCVHTVRLFIHIKMTFHPEFKSLKIISFENSDISVTIY